MIQMTESQFKSYSSDNLSEIVNLAMPYLKHREELYKRYSRKENENEFMGAGDKDSVIAAFEYYIVNMVQGYLGGKAPMYTVLSPSDYSLNKNNSNLFVKVMNKLYSKKNNSFKKEYVKLLTEAIEYIRRYNDDSATFVDIVHDYLITAAAYLYVYENSDNEIVYAPLSSRQTVAVYDFSIPKNLIGIIRISKEKNAEKQDVQVVELIDNERRRCFIGGELCEENVEELHWNNDVPCVAFENPDGIAVFEPAIRSISAFETNISNVKNMTKYNDNAKLIMTGYQYESPLMIQDENGVDIPNPARIAEEEAILNAQSLCVDTDGEIAWLIKDINYSGIMSTLKQYHELITMFTGVPNMTDEAFSNADNASALGYKLYALDQYSATFDRIAKKGLLRLWELIVGRLNLKGAKFDFRDISINLQRNIPTDRDKSLARAINAYESGLISQETALNESQLEVNAKDEIERIKTEEEEDYFQTRKRNEAFNGDEREGDLNGEVPESD